MILTGGTVQKTCIETCADRRHCPENLH
jgi:hypothetical protein